MRGEYSYRDTWPDSRYIIVKYRGGGCTPFYTVHDSCIVSYRTICFVPSIYWKPKSRKKNFCSNLLETCCLQ